MESKTNENFKYIKDKTVGIVGVIAREGQQLEGPEKAPEYLRNSGLYDLIKQLDWNFEEYDDIGESNIEIDNVDMINYKYTDLRNSLKIGAVCKKLHEMTKKIALEKQFCLTLGGDHGIASGSISGVKSVYPDLKIIWIDAQADANIPETSPSGNYHGMPVAHLLGWMGEKTVPGFDWFSPCLEVEDIVYIGLRDVDPEEKALLKKHGVKCFSMHEVDKYGIGGVMKQALDYLNKDGREHPLYVSYDVDGIDPEHAYGTGTKARGGLSYREAHYILRELAATGYLVGMELVEINPLIDRPKEIYHGDLKIGNCTQTVGLGLELIASALGNTLL